jgi:hypothetical protein
LNAIAGWLPSLTFSSGALLYETGKRFFSLGLLRVFLQGGSLSLVYDRVYWSD